MRILVTLLVLALSACADDMQTLRPGERYGEPSSGGSSYSASSQRLGEGCLNLGPGSVSCTPLQPGQIGPVAPERGTISEGGSGGPVHVRGYYRSNGTYVHSYTRRR